MKNAPKWLDKARAEALAGLSGSPDQKREQRFGVASLWAAVLKHAPKPKAKPAKAEE